MKHLCLRGKDLDPDYGLFAGIVEAGSLSAAGRTMLISPAMVSKRLARLEARLGVQLVQRTTRRLALTEAGEQFHADVLAILQAVRDAENRLTGIRYEPTGPLRVSAPTSFGRLHVAPHVASFLDAYPKIELDLDLTDVKVDLLVDRIDVAVRIASDLPASLQAHRLGSSRRVLCAAPTYLERYGMPKTIADLAGHRLLAASGQMPWRLVNGRRRHTVDGRSYVRTNSSEIVRELAIAGAGIALRSMWDVGDALRSGRLATVLKGWEGPNQLGIYALHPRASIVPPAVVAFVHFLQNSLSPNPWEAPDHRTAIA